MALTGRRILIFVVRRRPVPGALGDNLLYGLARRIACASWRGGCRQAQMEVAEALMAATLISTYRATGSTTRQPERRIATI